MSIIYFLLCQRGTQEPQTQPSMMHPSANRFHPSFFPSFNHVTILFATEAIPSVHHEITQQSSVAALLPAVRLPMNTSFTTS
mmetsp:Transcript_21864/g.62308  ORF Transcript_21864/g.62308 Transcript_21864/m.62308 type:complete len:82 (-) Transcript_21864:740-985(-)